MSASFAFTTYLIFYMINTLNILYLVPNVKYLIHLWILSDSRVLLLISLCGFIGFPPLAGFWIKLFAILAAFNYIYIPLVVATCVLVLTVISSFIYFKWLKYVYLIYDKIVHYPGAFTGYGLIITTLLMITASVLIFDYLIFMFA